MFKVVSTGLVASVVRYCCLCTVVFYNLVTFAMQENIEQRYCSVQEEKEKLTFAICLGFWKL